MGPAEVPTLGPPACGNSGCLLGFGVRITSGGAKAFVLNYRTNDGRERRATIGSVGAWTLLGARARAGVWRRLIDSGGGDPLVDQAAVREALRYGNWPQDSSGSMCQRAGRPPKSNISQF
ncbi:MAG: Arm DNA-binding domain-containing protein [Methylocella sp.]